MSLGWLSAHRGPFRLCVTRPFATKPGFFRSEWLVGEVHRDDVPDESQALLDDPRDTIISVSVWSVREECFVGGFRRA
jgi:hypothetical protein